MVLCSLVNYQFLTNQRKRNTQATNRNLYTPGDMVDETANQSAPSIEEMIESGNILAALATLTYSQFIWTQLVEGVYSEDFGHVTVELMERLVRDYPKLRAMLQSSSRDLDTQQVSVYQLLQGDSPFDISRLFGWQKDNTLAGEDAMLEMPHFSLPRLQSQYGHIERLHPQYFLLHGRPSFAFTTFLTAMMENGVKQIGDKQIMYACMEAHVLAIKSFLSPIVSAACVAYVELLGKDSTLLRVYIHMSTSLYAYRTRSLSGTLEARKEMEKTEELAVVDIMMNCFKNRQHVPTVQSLLEMLVEARSVQLERDNAKQLSMEHAVRWHPILLFCRLHSLPMDTTYLEWCAVQDDWLQFLTFSQLHHYSKVQLIPILKHFPSKSLREHLHCIIAHIKTKNATNDDVTTQKTRTSTAVREKFISRVLGERKGKKNVESSSSDNESESECSSSAGKNMNYSISCECPFTDDVMDDDLFRVLFSCLSTPVPHRALLHRSRQLSNPVLTVLAACCKGYSALDCICCYLRSYVTDNVDNDVIAAKCCHGYTLADLRRLTEIFTKKGHLVTLCKAYSIFVQECSLVPILRFCAAAVCRNWQEAKKQLNLFKSLIEQSRIVQRTQSAMTTSECILPPDWLASTTALVLHQLLASLQSTDDSYQTTSLLARCGINGCLRGTGLPDIDRLSKLLRISRDRYITVECRLLLTSDTYTAHCGTILEKLEEGGHFDDGRSFALRAGLDVNTVTMRQVESRLSRVRKSSIWTLEHGRMTFWKDCDQIFTNQIIPSHMAAEFFKKHSEQSHLSEKIYLCRLAYRWNRSSDSSNSSHQSQQVALDTSSLKDQEYRNSSHQPHLVALWQAQIEYEIHLLSAYATGDGRLNNDAIMLGDSFCEDGRYNCKNDLLVHGRMPSNTSSCNLTDKETEGLNSLLGKLLNRGHVTEASALAAQFAHFSLDLAIIVTCVRLALGVVTADQIDKTLKELISGSSERIARRRSRGMSLSMNYPFNQNGGGISILSTSPDQSAPDMDTSVTSDVQNSLSVMGSLLEHCQHGHGCCARVITVYRIAHVLNQNYTSVMVDNEFTVLEALLTSSYLDRFDLARDFILSSGLSETQLAEFLANSITSALSGTTMKTAEPLGDATDPVFNPLADNNTFISLIRLCSDPSLLGRRLLETATVLIDDDDTNHKILCTMEVELLIRAHDCFTTACHMKGISNVLRTARHLTEKLEKVEKFTLIIRLLIGIARYSEMTYIFDLLKHHQEFLLLFRKGIEKDGRLKLAVLDYLKRFHPSDIETYNMVALHYSMYREIALLLEGEAYKLLNEINCDVLDNDTETMQKLTQIEQYFCDAAESYMKEDCYRHAQSAMRQARLVALQQQLLPSSVHVLNLSTDTLSKFIINHDKFSDAFIVAEAYGKRTEWPSALCQRVVVHGDWRYWNELTMFVPVNDSLFEEVVERYKLEKTTNANIQVNMKRLLRSCQLVETRYRLALSLGFTDFTQELLRGEAASYLKDVLGITD